MRRFRFFCRLFAITALLSVAACSSSSASSSTGDSNYRCDDTGSDCTCFDPPQSGFDQRSCGSYACCYTTRATFADGTMRNECDCTSDAPCVPPTNAARVGSCP